MRVLLFTGKGGVGKTTVAAATAVRAADAGLRTLVMSTDPAHSLGDSFDEEIGSRPTQIAERLWAQQIDAQERLEDNWREIQDYMIQLMNWAGTETIQAEELTVLPGLDEIFALIDVKTHVESGAYDVLIVDCAPTAETLRLLSLPDVMQWYIERIFPVERQDREDGSPARVAGDVPADRGRPRVRCRGAAPPQPRRGEEDPHRRGDVVGPPGGQPGEDGHRRSAAHVHLPRPVRLPGGCGGREPRPAARCDRSVLRQVEGHPGGAPRHRPRVLRAGADPARRASSTGR